MPVFWTEFYQAHFERFFQKPFDVQIYHDEFGNALKIATHDRAVPDFRVLASIGLADKLAANDENFGEVILFVDVPDHEVPMLFVNALFFILQHNIPLSSRFSIGGIARMSQPFAARHGKSALYFTLSQDENELFNKVRGRDEFGHVYQAFFITPDEDRYLDDYGADEFEKKLYERSSDLYSIRRKCCLLSDSETDGPRTQPR